VTGEIRTALIEIGEFSGQVADSFYERINDDRIVVSIEGVVALGGALFMAIQDVVTGEEYSVPVQDMDPLEADRIAGYFLRWFNAEDRSEF
jgi:Ni,Fe-hydrogenase III small subunit